MPAEGKFRSGVDSGSICDRCEADVVSIRGRRMVDVGRLPPANHQVRPLERCLRGLLMSSDAHATMSSHAGHAARRRSALPLDAAESAVGEEDRDRDERELGVRAPVLRSPMVRQVSPHGVSFLSDAPSAVSSGKRMLDGGLHRRC